MVLEKAVTKDGPNWKYERLHNRSCLVFILLFFCGTGAGWEYGIVPAGKIHVHAAILSLLAVTCRLKIWNSWDSTSPKITVPTWRLVARTTRRFPHSRVLAARLRQL